MVCSSSSSKHNTGKASERANRNRMSKRRPRLGAARRAAPKGSHERLLGHPNPPDELGGNSPHCAGDRVLETTEGVGGHRRFIIINIHFIAKRSALLVNARVH